MLRIVCLVILWLFVALYMLALFAFIVGTLGWFGAEKDPLSGIFLAPLGAPWISLVHLLPEPAWSFGAALTPAINIGILYGICHWLGNRQRAR